MQNIKRTHMAPISEKQKVSLSIRQLRRLISESKSDDDFEIDDNGVLVKYYGVGGVVVIPDGVVEIAAGAFAGIQVVSIKIPDSVRRIGAGAFQDCPIEELDVPRRLLRPILNNISAAFDETPILDYFRNRRDTPYENRARVWMR